MPKTETTRKQSLIEREMDLSIGKEPKTETTDECPGICQLTGERCPPECTAKYQPCAKARDRVMHETTQRDVLVDLKIYGHGDPMCRDAVREIERLRSLVRGCEIAIARDGSPEAAFRMIREDRENHGY